MRSVGLSSQIPGALKDQTRTALSEPPFPRPAPFRELTALAPLGRLTADAHLSGIDSRLVLHHLVTSQAWRQDATDIK